LFVDDLSARERGEVGGERFAGGGIVMAKEGAVGDAEVDVDAVPGIPQLEAVSAWTSKFPASVQRE